MISLSLKLPRLQATLSCLCKAFVVQEEAELLGISCSMVSFLVFDVPQDLPLRIPLSCLSLEPRHGSSVQNPKKGRAVGRFRPRHDARLQEGPSEGKGARQHEDDAANKSSNSRGRGI